MRARMLGTVAILSATALIGACGEKANGKTEDPKAHAAAIPVEVRTPLATISAQAVDMWSGPVEGGLGVLVIGGKLDVRNDAGWVMLDRKRQGTLVSSRMVAPQKPGQWSAEHASRMLHTVAFK